MEKDWKKQVSARRNETVGKAVVAPSPTILLPGQCPLRPHYPQPGP